MNVERKNNFWFFTGVLLVCFAVSAGVRYKQFETWKTTRAAYFVGERPMMTTLDAPFWLHMARVYNEGTYGKNLNLRSYPRNSEIFEEMSVPQKFRDQPPTSSNSTSSSQPSSTGTLGTKYLDTPLLSFLIAHLTPFFNYNYYLTGTLLIPLFASLFVLPFGVYFFRIGVPVSGLLGGLIATFSSGYYMRSSIGRIDTDMLNLFFPLLASLLVFLASRAKTERSALLYSVGAGLSMFLFQWWYGKAVFTLAYFAVLVLSMFVQQIRFRTILLSSLLFVLCAHPDTFLGGTDSVIALFSRYFVIELAAPIAVIDIETAPATFPNTMTTISEVSRVPMDEVFKRVLSNPLFAWIGFLAFFGMALMRWRALLPLVPILALGLLSFQSSNRFIMFLAPFIGIGLGWLLQLGVEAIFILITKNIHHREDKEDKGKSKKVKVKRLKGKGSFWAKIISWLSMDEDENGAASKLKEGTEALRHKGTEFKEGTKALRRKGTEGTDVDWWNWARQGVLYLGMGLFFWLISGQTAISFVPRPSIHPKLYATFYEVKKRVPRDSVLLTWWDYGYAIYDVTGLGIFHDGSTQFSPKTFFIARGLISPDAGELYDITQFLATEGNRGIEEYNISPQALLKAVRNPEQKPWNPIYLFFTADMTVKYGAISKIGSWDMVNGEIQPRGYQNLACNEITNVEMNCRGAKIDLKAGKINNQVALKRMVFIRDGKVLREQEFVHAQGYTLQLLVAGQRIVEVQLIDEVVFRSNYNQMFLLGRFREDLFEETYNAFPFSRLFRVKY